MPAPGFPVARSVSSSSSITSLQGSTGNIAPRQADDFDDDIESVCEQPIARVSEKSVPPSRCEPLVFATPTSSDNAGVSVRNTAASYPTSSSPLAGHIARTPGHVDDYNTLSARQKEFLDNALRVALKGGKGLVQFVSPAAHHRHPTRDWPIAQYLEGLSESGTTINGKQITDRTLSIGDKRYTVVSVDSEEPLLNAGDSHQAARYRVTLKASETGEIITFPITQIGLSFRKNHFTAEEIARVMGWHRAHMKSAGLADDRAKDPIAAQVSNKQDAVHRIEQPGIISFRGIGRNAVLVTVLEVLRRIEQNGRLSHKASVGEGAGQSLVNGDAAFEVKKRIGEVISEAREQRSNFLGLRERDRALQLDAIEAYLVQEASQTEGLKPVDLMQGDVLTEPVSIQQPVTTATTTATTTAATTEAITAETTAATTAETTRPALPVAAAHITPIGIPNPTVLCYFISSLQLIIHAMGARSLINNISKVLGNQQGQHDLAMRNVLNKLKSFLEKYVGDAATSFRMGSQASALSPLEVRDIQALHNALWPVMTNLHNNNSAAEKTAQQDAVAAFNDLVDWMSRLRLLDSTWVKTTAGWRMLFHRQDTSIIDKTETPDRQALIPALSTLHIETGQESQTLQELVRQHMAVKHIEYDEPKTPPQDKQDRQGTRIVANQTILVSKDHMDSPTVHAASSSAPTADMAPERIFLPLIPYRVVNIQTGETRKVGLSNLKLHEKVSLPVYRETKGQDAPSDDWLKKPENVEYEVTALMAHKGSSIHSGHYIAAIRNPAGNGWTVLDDANRIDQHGSIDAYLNAGDAGKGFQPVMLYLKRTRPSHGADAARAG